MRHLYALLLVCLFAVFAIADPKAYVINGGSNTVTVIDLGTQSAVGSISTGGAGSEMYVMIDNRYALLTEPGDNMLRKLDLWGASPGVSTASVALPASPGSIIVNLRGNSIWSAYAYVASEASNSVSIVGVNEGSPAALTLVKSIGGFDHPIQVNQALDGKHIYVVNAAPSQAAGSISVIDTGADPATQSVTATVQLPAGHPNQFALHASGKAFITAPDAGKLYEFDPATGAFVGPPADMRSVITPQAQPNLIVFSPDNRLMFVLDKVGLVYVFNMSLTTGAATYAGSFNVGTNPVDMAVTSDNKFAYVACQGSSEVWSIDMSSGNLANIFSGPVSTHSGSNVFAGKVPVGVQFDSNENYAYVVLSGSNQVALINTSNDQVPATGGYLATGSAPVGLVQLNQPYVYPGGMVNGASFAPNTPTAIGTIVSIFGEGLVETGGAADPAHYPPLPTTIGGTQVLFNGIAAPLFYTSGTQINAVVPTEMKGLATATLKVVGPNGEDLKTVPISTANPGLFTYPPGGVGDGIIQNASQGNILVNQASPATSGNVIVIYGTGFGETNPIIPDGTGATAPAPIVTLPATVTINGQPVSAQDLQYVGAAGQWAGLYQINLTVPALATGKCSLALTINGSTSNSVNLYVK